MKEGSVVLTPIPQADGIVKSRPAVVLREMPPFQNLLVCGVSTQLHHRVKGFDEIISLDDDDFDSSGLLAPSIIRLGFLTVLPRRRVVGAIGYISSKRHQQLLQTLPDYLVKRPG